MLKRKPTQTISLILIGLVLLVAYTWAFQVTFTSKVPGANDFFSQYGGAYLYFVQGINPYSLEATEWIQLQLSGATVTRGTITNDFVYPFYTIFVVAPYVVLPNYAWVQAAWQVTLQVMMVASMLIILRYFSWRPRPWLFGLLMLWMLLFYPTFRALILGQMSIVVFISMIVSFWLLFREGAGNQMTRDILAGFFIALSTIKPQMQFLIIPFMVLWGLRNQRWMFLGAAAGSMLLLAGISFLMLPSWLEDWVFQLTAYTTYTPPGVLFILTNDTLALGAVAQTIELILTVGISLYLLYIWWHVLVENDRSQLDWALGLTLVITHLIAPRTATTHYIVFLFPLTLMLRDWIGRKQNTLAYGVLALMLVGLWVLFIQTTIGEAEANIMFVPLPLLMLALVVMTRPRQETAKAVPNLLEVDMQN